MKQEAIAADAEIWDIRSVRTRRSIILASLGALVGLGIAGFALFTAKGTSTLVVPAEDVALVNQQPIARSDFQQLLQNTLGVGLADATPAQKKKVLDDMIREELFVQRGKELDVGSTDPDVRTAMVGAVEQAIAADATSSVPSDEKLRAFYAQHQDEFSSVGMITVRDLVFPPEHVDAALAQLRSGAPADSVLEAQGGHDSRRTSGEEFYFAAKAHLGPVLFQTATALSSGQVSGPLAQSDGVHLLDVIRNQKPLPLDFQQARLQVLDAYQKAAVARAEAADERFFRKRANILLAKDAQ